MRARRLVAALLLCILAALAAAEGVALPRPGLRDTCPVCGMLVAKYPNWTAIALYRDGHAHFFDGAKDLFKYWQNYARYAPGHRREDVAGLYVTEFYGLRKIEAGKAFYVIGSDAMGPMGHELVPLETRADAEDFLKDHKGARILTFGEVTPAVVGELDAGRF
jgi:nitrous oxide reductase accessory protein NosL